MRVEVLAFGIAKDILKNNKLEIEVPDEISVSGLKEKLTSKYPAFQQLKSLRLAVDAAYRDDDYIIGAGAEVAIIPPVSGG